MGIAYIVVGLLSATVAVFALQNNQPMSLRFINWTIDGVPLAGAILGALAVGLILAAVPLQVAQWRWKRRARALETKVATLEAAVASRGAEPSVLVPRAPAAPVTRSA